MPTHITIPTALQYAQAAAMGNLPLVDGSDISWNVGSGAWASVTLEGANNFETPTGFVDTQILILEVNNPNIFEPTFSSDFRWPLPDNTPPTPTGTKQFYTFACSGGLLYGSMLDFTPSE